MLVIFQILVGSALVLVTTAVHGLCTIAAVSVTRRRDLDARVLRTTATRLRFVSGCVLLLWLVVIFEAALWAAVYRLGGALPDFGTALYFSAVTFTTLGYGDVVLHDEGWRLLAAIQAALGIIIFGWTTALLVALVQRIVRPPPRA